MSSFPKTFLWGAAVSAHQVEGGNRNQWSVWELAHANQLAKGAKSRLGYISKLSGHGAVAERNIIQASNPDNYVSGRAVDHYNRYEQDFDLLQDLNLNSFRFSIEWSRIEPSEGVWDEKAIEYYRNYLKSLKRRKIEPIVTLWHWTVPIWFSEKGEFEKAANIKYFERFVKKIISEYGDDLRYVITLNEPGVHVWLSYVLGLRPPQVKNRLMAIKVMRNLVQAHKRAYKVIKANNIALRVGVSYALTNFVPKKPNSMTHGLSAKLSSYRSNWWFLDQIKRSQDFMGVNYYFTEYKKTSLHLNYNPKYPTNDLGWYMEPESIYSVLMATWQRYHKPIIITENGLADSEDKWRKWWLEQTMNALRKALSEGVDLRGYMHWSLLDNFEWDDGWWPQFGLFKVDRAHGMKRIPRDSARWYANYIASEK